jgi:hypothetical protein
MSTEHTQQHVAVFPRSVHVIQALHNSLSDNSSISERIGAFYKRVYIEKRAPAVMVYIRQHTTRMICREVHAMNQKQGCQWVPATRLPAGKNPIRVWVWGDFSPTGDLLGDSFPR